MPSNPTDIDDEATSEAEETIGEEDLDDDFDDEDLDDAQQPDSEPVDGGSTSRGRRIARRALTAVLATLVFEVLYAIGIALITFFSEGAAAVGPTLGSAVATPFAWAPAAVFLVCAFVFVSVLREGRRNLLIGSLIGAIVVYLGSTLLILLAAGGWAAVPVYSQELGVYPFFLTGIVAREVLAWTGPRRG
jgi:hypothetical protein